VAPVAWRLGPAGPGQLEVVERVQEDGTSRFTLRRLGWVFCRVSREWELEPAPADQDAWFLERCRFREWIDAVDAAISDRAGEAWARRADIERHVVGGLPEERGVFLPVCSCGWTGQRTDIVASLEGQRHEHRREVGHG
jgi:hypothetical protein